jgi:spermidine/putrescine-binding protein
LPAKQKQPLQESTHDPKDTRLSADARRFNQPGRRHGEDLQLVGLHRPGYHENFQKDTGIAFTYDVYDSNETLDGKLMTGKSGYDVVFPSNHFMARQIQGKALKNSTRASCRTGKPQPGAAQGLAINDPGNEHGFPYLWGSTGIGYNIAKVKRYWATTRRWIPGT